MTINIIINGAAGRMGKLATHYLTNDARFAVVATLDRHDDLTQALAQHQPDIVLELTDANSVFDNSHCIIRHGIRPVIGASGLTNDQINTLQQLAQEHSTGGIIVPNFSIGAVLMMRCAADIATYLPKAEIIEMHHEGKLDSPSGTAMATANRINTARNQPDADTPIHSVRLPGLLAKQQVLFGGHAETVTIEHNTLHREAFMPGIALACDKVMCFDTLKVGLEHCL